MSYHDPDYEIDLEADNAHTRVIGQVGTGKKVLELGCATGYMSRVLSERFHCRVTGIERDPIAAEKAKRSCERVIVGDLEALDFSRALGSEAFEVVICADVLEHLRDPVAPLTAIRQHLAPGGYVVASIPNVAHASVVAELLEGRFRYRPEGLLDGTHLRFFTLESIHDCFERAGYAITRLERVRIEPECTEFRTDLASFPAEVAKAIRSHPESTTYQFVLSAVAAEASPAAAVEGNPPERVQAALRRRDRNLDADPALEAVFSRLQFLEDRRLGLTQEVGKLREDCLHRDVRIHHLEQEAQRKAAVIAEQEREIQRLRANVSRSGNSLVHRLWRRARRAANGPETK